MAGRRISVDRRRSEQVSTWVTPAQKALIVAYAEGQDKSVSELAYRLILREVSGEGRTA